MESVTLFEWAVGAIFVGFNAYRRYNTPASNRATTTFQNFITYFFFYLISMLTLYVFFGALFDSSPETIGALYGLMTGQLNATLPSQLSSLSAPMLSALFLTTLLPSLPWLSKIDSALLSKFWERGHIPTHVNKMAAAMRRAPFNLSPGQSRRLKQRAKQMEIDFDQLQLDNGVNLDFRWARINALLDSIADWKDEDSARLRRFMQQQETTLAQLNEKQEEINRDFSELKTARAEPQILQKLEHYLDKSITELFRATTLLVARAACMAELSESGRASLISQLGFEGGSHRRDRLSAGQVAGALVAILLTFFAVSVVQELSKPVEYRHFGNVAFMTFLMFFTYGAALIIALNLKCQNGMGYNELTRRRSWAAYVIVGLITTASWLIVTISYRYILNMLSGMDSLSNLEQVLTSIRWSYPYALQSLALAVAISWILDYHQSQELSGLLPLRQRMFDVSFAVTALTIASIIAYYWMEGLGLFEGIGTKDPQYRGRMSLDWMVLKGAAVGGVIGWLVPTWFNMNRLKAPDQIAGRLIGMNRHGLSREIRTLEPDELIEAVAAVGATMALADGEVSRSEKDVYQIICSHLAGLPSADVDIDAAEKAFDQCLELVKKNELELEQHLHHIKDLPLLSALMPYIASSIAFADGIYMKQERLLVEQIRQSVKAPSLLEV